MMLKTPIAISISGLMVLTACTNTTTRIDNPNYRAQTGALAGAAFGTIAGLAAGGGKGHEAQLRSTLLGAAVGAGVGAAIGANLDAQAAELRNTLGNPNVTVTNMGSYLLVTLPDDVTFATDSATLRPDLAREVQSIAANLVSYPNSTVQVIGNTDNTGTAAYNMDLSQRRAIAVRELLVGAGVPGDRIAAAGVGEDRPVASNLTPEGRAQNRRVDIIITPKN